MDSQTTDTQFFEGLSSVPVEPAALESENVIEFDCEDSQVSPQFPSSDDECGRDESLLTVVGSDSSSVKKGNTGLYLLRSCIP